jgi:hypothetical protein
MTCKVHNKSNRDVSDLQQMMKSFMPFAQKRIGFNKPPNAINFESDDINARNALGKTGFYDPQNMSITVFVDGRHPKDILRSLAHELVHHGQNCRGDFAMSSGLGEQGYAQKDPHLREMEREAYEVGNLCFRDWEDNYKQQTNYVQVDVSLSEGKQPRSKNMGIYDKKHGKIHERLMEQWGYVVEESDEEEVASEKKAADEEEKDMAAARKQRKEREQRQRDIREGEGEDEPEEEEEEELEERRGRGRDREGMEPDERRRPMEELRKLIRTTIQKKLMEKNNG